MLDKCWTQKQSCAKAIQTVPTWRQPFPKFDCGEQRTGDQILSYPDTDFCDLMRVYVCATIVEQSVQTASTPFNIFENKGKVESKLNESSF